MKSGVGNASKANHFRTLEQRIGELLNQAGNEYGMAIWSCFTGLSPLIESKRTVTAVGAATGLDDLKFKDDVYSNIVCPLEKYSRVCIPCDPASTTKD